MALEVVYEGKSIAGMKNVDATELQTAASSMTAGKVVCLTVNSLATKAANTIYVGGSSLGNFVNSVDVPFGLLADDKSDIIASGKASVYFTPGLYKTDQVSATPAKGDLLSFTTVGLVATAATSDYIIGVCTEAAGSDGMLELYLNITGAVSA